MTDQAPYGFDESKIFTVGPTAEVALPHHFAIETGFLFKRIGTSYRFRYNNSDFNQRLRGNSFEIPVVGKYYLHDRSIFKPYLGLGVAARRTFQTSELSPPRSTFESLSPWGLGAVAAAGVQFGAGRLKLSPEVRYTRWSREGQQIPRNRNQAEFLLGISF